MSCEMARGRIGVIERMSSDNEKGISAEDRARAKRVCVTNLFIISILE